MKTVAKDGSGRGGARPGAGRKPKALTEKISEGKTAAVILAKHPTTGAAIASPYVSMSQSYMKQTNYCWMQIYQIVKENCSVEFQGNTPQDDVMERLLRARKDQLLKVK